MKMTTCILAAALALPLLQTRPGVAATNSAENATPAPAAMPAITAPAADTAAPLVIIIPVADMIERGLLYVIRRSLAAAVRENATAIILDMNTPGGRVDRDFHAAHLHGPRQPYRRQRHRDRQR